MRAILCAALAAALCVPALADSIARVGADWVQITALPCSDEGVLAKITEAGEDAHDYRAASAEFGGQKFSACSRFDFKQRIVFLRYADGDQGRIPFDAFKPLKEA